MNRRFRIRCGLAGCVMAGLAAAAAVVPASGAHLFGLVDTGEIYRSTDGGASWSPIAALPVRDAIALVARSTASDLFLATRSGGVYRSTDGGPSWNAVGAIPSSDVVDLGVTPDGGLLLLTARGTIFRSDDLGASFTSIASLTGSNFGSLASSGAMLYVLTRSGEVYESSDGSTWVAKAAIAVSGARHLRAMQANLYVLTETGDIFRSMDAATSWTAIGSLSQVGMRGLVRNGMTLVVASREGHVASSTDGASWTWQGSINQLALSALASDEPLATDASPDAPAGLFLGAPYPNPSAGSISIALRLERDAALRILLYDVAGRLVMQGAPGSFPAGAHRLAWDAGALRAGHYFLKIESSLGQNATRRLVLRP